MSDLQLWDVDFHKDFYLEIDSEISFTSEKAFHQEDEPHEAQDVDITAQRTRAKWTITEDRLLQSLQKTYGPDWDRISKWIPGKSPLLISKRWALRFDPNLKHTRWTREEDDNILHYFSKYGGKWIRIAHKIPRRHPDSIKNRYYSVLRKRMNISNKKVLEEAQQAQDPPIDRFIRKAKRESLKKPLIKQIEKYRDKISDLIMQIEVLESQDSIDRDESINFT